MMINKILADIFTIEPEYNPKVLKWKNVLFRLICLSVISFLLMFSCIFFTAKPRIDSAASDFYNSIPNFEVSKDGFKVEGGLEYNSELMGTNITINSDKTFISMMYENTDEHKKEHMYIGKDGYGTVKDGKLIRSSYFANVPALENTSLVKADFPEVFDFFRLMLKSNLIRNTLSLAFGIIIFFLLRIVCCAIAIKLMFSLISRKIEVVRSVVASISVNTFSMLIGVIILMAPMNIGFIVRIAIIETITLVKLITIIKKYKVKGDIEDEKKKKKHKKRCK